MKKRLIWILSVIALFGLAILLNVIGNTIHKAIYAREENEALFNRLMYLRHSFYGLLFLTGFSGVGYGLIKQAIKQKNPKTTLYQSFVTGEKLLLGLLITSGVYQLLLAVLALSNVKAISLETFTTFMFIAYPIGVVFIVIIFGRDSTYVMDND